MMGHKEKVKNPLLYDALYARHIVVFNHSAVSKLKTEQRRLVRRVAKQKVKEGKYDDI